MELQVLFLGRLEIFADLLQDERCRLKTETVYGLLLFACYYGMWLFSACHRACLSPGSSFLTVAEHFALCPFLFHGTNDLRSIRDVYIGRLFELACLQANVLCGARLGTEQ